jgi:hypothetical protein
MIAKRPFVNGHSTKKGDGDNTFKGKLEQLPPPQAISAEDAAEAMHQDGFVQFPDVFSADEVREIRTWMDSLGGPDQQYEVKNWCFNKHIQAQLHRDPMCLRLIDRSPCYETLALILGHGFLVGGINAWVTGKGRAMGTHIDYQDVSLPEEYLQDPRVRMPIFNCTLHFYFDDQVEEIGPTTVIPGSWRAGRFPVDEPTWHGNAPKMISVKAGGAVLFRPDLWHGAGMNSSDRRRYLIQVFYGMNRTRGYFPPIAVPERYAPEVLAQVTARQKTLLGDRGEPSSAY